MNMTNVLHRRTKTVAVESEYHGAGLRSAVLVSA